MNKLETNVVKPNLSFTENDQEYLILDSQSEHILDKSILDIEEYLKNTTKEGKTDEDKDNAYAQAQDLWRKYADNLRNTKYNFYLNRSQYQFLTDLILSKLEYDVNTVFFAIELTDMMGSMKDAKYTSDIEIISFPVDATEITYIYHLISKHKIKGLCKSAYTFAQVLRRIGDISKIFNYYDASAKSLTTDIQNWAVLLDDNVTQEAPKLIQETKTKKIKKPEEV